MTEFGSTQNIETLVAAAERRKTLIEVLALTLACFLLAKLLSHSTDIHF